MIFLSCFLANLLIVLRIIGAIIGAVALSFVVLAPLLLG